MTRPWLLLLAIMAAPLPAQESAKQPQEPAQQSKEQLPEEDESFQTKEYGFNPIQAAKEMKVGEFYFKKGSYQAAANRFREATRWDATLAEAHFRLGEALERAKNEEEAREAYKKYLELEPEGKKAESVRKKLAAKPTQASSKSSPKQ